MSRRGKLSSFVLQWTNWNNDRCETGPLGQRESGHSAYAEEEGRLDRWIQEGNKNGMEVMQER